MFRCVGEVFAGCDMEKLGLHSGDDNAAGGLFSPPKPSSSLLEPSKLRTEGEHLLSHCMREEVQEANIPLLITKRICLSLS